MVEYGVPAGEASTVVELLGGGAWRDSMSHISVYSSWAPLSLAHWLERLASFAGSTDSLVNQTVFRERACARESELDRIS